MKILFIGNSYTFDNSLAKMFEALANENGKEVSAFSVAPGGRELLDYEKRDEATIELEGLISENLFDVCFIQEESTMPMKAYDRFEKGVKIILEMLGEKAKRVILFNTWGRKEGCPETLPEYGWTNESMTMGLWEGYSKAAQKFGLSISAVGLNFFEINTNHKDIDLYNEDLAHPSYKGSCLACMTHYYTVFGESPASTSTLKLSAKETEIFKNTICKKHK